MPYKNKADKKKWHERYDKDYRAAKNEPSSVRASKEYYQFWKSLEDLTFNELQFLITKRKQDLRYAKGKEVKELRTHLKLLVEKAKQLSSDVVEIKTDAINTGHGYIEPSEQHQREHAVLPGTGRIDWVKAENGWTNYYDNGVVTLNPDLFFRKEYKPVTVPLSRKNIYK